MLVADCAPPEDLRQGKEVDIQQTALNTLPTKQGWLGVEEEFSSLYKRGSNS